MGLDVGKEEESTNDYCCDDQSNINNRVTRMGILESKPVVPLRKKDSCKAIEDIYLMFQQSNKIIIASTRQKNKPTYQYAIKNIEQLLNELLQSFLEQQKYLWGCEIFDKFKSHFMGNFQMIWYANRQQFYELLLMNCHAIPDRSRVSKTFQKYFYQVAVNKIEEKIPNSYIDDFMKEEKNINLMNHSILNGIKEDADLDLPLFIPTQQQKVEVEMEMAEFIRQVPAQSPASIQLQASRMRMQNCSLLLPETVFVDRLSANTEVQVSDLLKYYNQFVNTVNQLFYSNNLVSCPLKHFIFAIEQKILKKNIKHSHVQQANNTANNEQARKIRKIRQQNNNIILYEVKSFLQAYTSFVWMYLELHQMAQSRLGKIINSDILYGIIFKSVWNFIDWISQRGYEFQQAKLQEYYKHQQLNNQAKLSSDQVNHLLTIAEGLRKEKHPQQYLKKVVILYRQVSQHCQNADDLLMIYEYILGLAIKGRGSKDLYIFRMRNIIQKLLKIDDNSMSGGQISYSWTTWCILIELLRQKINYQYGNLIISKESFSHMNQTSSFTLEQSIVKNGH